MYKLVLSVIASLLLVLTPPVEAKVKATGKARAERTASAGKARKHIVIKSRAHRREIALRPAAESRNTMVRRTVMVRGKRKLVYQRVIVAAALPERARQSAGDLAGLNQTRDPLDLKSNVAFVLDQNNAEVLFEKNANIALPIASITKLMTGLIVVEARQDLDEVLTVTDDDVDHEKFTSSRLRVGSQMTRANLLHIALMSSENRAAAALARNYPGGVAGFVAAMNAKAHQLGMRDTRYVDSSGLSSRNVASARDLAKLAMFAYNEPLLRQYSTDPKSTVDAGGRLMHYNNTNYLVAMPDWDIGLQKTGFINEAGRCLVMQTVIQGRAVIMVFLDSKGKQSRTADAGRMRRWLEALRPPGLS
ncbi:D-alanyl-D-alanine endopeptidase [Massilia antarctica]|uniref:D-alanyl-D-alanine endopeptidase n=1 Tax=Massilia antarctica TaxID=2765360 RepID=A0AA48WEZ9_9BURK|nr:D-alanyl-D-alanine endopeptidase [Massilia antarctica]QPI50302.1 D-alanyl-D-alanine endopeptidase [Massilia antarctica]